LHVAFCDVGQGDATVIVLGPFQALVDTGADKNKALKCLGEQMPFWDKRIEVVFISHADKDHAGALPEIKKRYIVDRVVDNPNVNDIVRYGLLSFDIVKGSEPVESLIANSSETNAKSVVMRLVYGDFSVLFTGDTDLNTELALVSTGVLGKSKVLKVSHHGSKYGSGNEFLLAVSPSLAIVSVGEKNTYGHPSGDTLIRLDTVGAKVLRTDKSGMISLVSDGKNLEVFTEK
jgi:competence protein ComEC